jgi:hypothetical protein
VVHFSMDPDSPPCESHCVTLFSCTYFSVCCKAFFFSNILLFSVLWFNFDLLQRMLLLSGGFLFQIEIVPAMVIYVDTFELTCGQALGSVALLNVLMSHFCLRYHTTLFFL